MSHYYLGRTSKGAAVLRKSTRSDFTVAIANAETGSWQTFSTSATQAWDNLTQKDVGGLELVKVALVDRKAYMAAKVPEKAATTPVVDLQDATAIALAGGPYETREAWLLAFVTASRPMFEAAGAELPERVRVSVGFPSKGSRSKVIGECWTAKASADGVSEVFIVPGLQADPARIADVLTHELIHAALGTEEGHGPNFRRVMKRLGLEGKATATVAGDGWRQWALPIVEALGAFPGAELQSGLALAGGKKTQTTRYLKVMCSCCDWTARVTAKHLADHEVLSCPIPTCAGELGQAV
ncbi:SprT-like domain-containing protein [Sphingomonas melonis]|uniref:SprT-like domain-containing protein n=1 Tax=Sphingomonas melonis TaxID=152682 RepID=UPI0035C80739